MSTTVPASTSTAAGWTVSQYVDDDAAATVDANGVALVTFGPVATGQLWQITRAVVNLDPAGAGSPLPECRVYVGTDTGAAGSQRALRSGTNDANYDEADYPGDGLQVSSGELVMFRFTGAPVGATAVAAVQYRLLTSG